MKNYNMVLLCQKISALSPSTIDKNEYLTDEEILTSDQSRVIRTCKVTYYSVGKS